MRFFVRLAATLHLIRHALIPKSYHLHQELNGPFPDGKGAVVVSPETLFPLIRRPQRFPGNGRIHTFIPDVLAPAAPFVLFRLKRWGFSGCRVIVEETGLRIEAHR